MKKFTKVIALLLAMVLLISNFPVTGVVARAQEEEGCTHHSHDPAVCSFRAEQLCDHQHKFSHR